jgi:predicted nuclease of predicted toxin-antitoxin system
MRFLVDECTGPKLAAWLRDEGHQVFSVFDEARGAEDDEVIQRAYDENWIYRNTNSLCQTRWIVSIQ